MCRKPDWLVRIFIRPLLNELDILKSSFKANIDYLSKSVQQFEKKNTSND